MFWLFALVQSVVFVRLHNLMTKEKRRQQLFVTFSSELNETVLCFAAAKKTKKQVYVSYSLPVTDGNISLLVEDRIKKELELHPEHF